MKRLNKHFPDSPLNKKLRILYARKQRINNSHQSQGAKEWKMKDCDREINRAWRWHYANKPGYEIVAPDESSDIHCDQHALKFNIEIVVDLRDIEDAMVKRGWNRQDTHKLGCLLLGHYANNSYNHLYLWQTLYEWDHEDEDEMNLKQAALDLLREQFEADSILVTVNW